MRDAATKKCTVVETKPTTTTTTVVSDGVYKTKVEAESAVKTTKICTSSKTLSSPKGQLASSVCVKETDRPVLLLWAVPAVIVIGGAGYWLVNLH